MDIKELTDLLVTSSETINQNRYIPWWEDDYEAHTYKYRLFKEEVVQAAEACLSECGKETLLTPVGRYGLTLFHLLVWHNFYNMVEHMLSDGRVEGEEVNMPDQKGYGFTPFLLACGRGNLAMVRLLLDHGADPAACDKRGMNAYHFLACPSFDGLMDDYSSNERSVEQRAIIARLLDLDVNQKDGEGLTPLVSMLSKSNNPNYTWTLAEVFLEKGADTGYVDEKGNTLLMMAIKNEHFTAALKLMEQCRNMINVADQNGVTPIQRATDYQLDALSLALTDHGASPLDTKPVNFDTLCEITNRAYGLVYDDKRDGLSLALYASKKLLKQVDMDDDEELEEIAYILGNALKTDPKCHMLDMCKDAGLDFSAPVYCGNETMCLRDKCIGIDCRSDSIKKLAELGVDMDKAVVDGRTPVYIIASMDRERDERREAFFGEAAKFFSRESMEQLDNNGMSAIHMAVRNGHTGMLNAMIEKGVNVNLTEDKPAEAGVTPLHEACIYGHRDAIRLLIAAGADDTMKNLTGETPAHFAVMKKNRGEELTLEQRAELLKELRHLDIPREDGKTPLMLLPDLRASRELLSLFIEKGADVNHVNDEGMTIMMLTTDKDMVKELIRAGGNIHMADKEGNTVLHHALMHGNTETARYLIRKGADYNCVNNKGESPMQLAAEKGYDTVLELML